MLNFTIDDNTGAGGVRSKTRWEARSVRSQLMLACFWQSEGRPKALRRLIDSKSHAICLHVNINPNWQGDQTSVMSCSLCATDYYVNVAKRAASGGAWWRLNVATYHNPGSLRSPNDWQWTALTKFAPSIERSSQPGYASGSVRQQWKMGDATIPGPGGAEG